MGGKADRVGDKGSLDTTMFDLWTVSVLFLNMSLTCACVMDEDIFVLW